MVDDDKINSCTNKISFLLNNIIFLDIFLSFYEKIIDLPLLL